MDAEPEPPEPPRAPASWPEPLLTARDLARVLRISARSLEERLAEGEAPPPLRIGRLRRWAPEAVRAWLDQKVRLAARLDR